jgi:hypothetical protein
LLDFTRSTKGTHLEMKTVLSRNTRTKLRSERGDLCRYGSLQHERRGDVRVMDRIIIQPSRFRPIALLRWIEVEETLVAHHNLPSSVLVGGRLLDDGGRSYWWWFGERDGSGGGLRTEPRRARRSTWGELVEVVAVSEGVASMLYRNEEKGLQIWVDNSS